MTDAAKPSTPVAGFSPHSHDLRVDPSQVIILVGDEMRIQVVCADPSCGRMGFVYSKPKRAIDAGDPRTWRAYRYTKGDAIRMDGANGRKPSY